MPIIKLKITKKLYRRIKKTAKMLNFTKKEVILDAVDAYTKDSDSDDFDEEVYEDEESEEYEDDDSDDEDESDEE